MRAQPPPLPPTLTVPLSSLRSLPPARLLAALATEVLEAWKKVENSVVSMAAVGLAVDSEAAGEAAAACRAAAALLDALFPAVLAALRAGSDEVAAAVVPFLLAYVARLRAAHKRAPGGVLPADAAAHLPAILDALAACARFPDRSAAYEVAAASATERWAAGGGGSGSGGGGACGVMYASVCVCVWWGPPHGVRRGASALGGAGRVWVRMHPGLCLPL